MCFYRLLTITGEIWGVICYSIPWITCIFCFSQNSVVCIIVCIGPRYGDSWLYTARPSVMAQVTPMLINIGSGGGLVPSGNRPLPEPMVTQTYATLWRH